MRTAKPKSIPCTIPLNVEFVVYNAIVGVEELLVDYIRSRHPVSVPDFSDLDADMVDRILSVDDLLRDYVEARVLEWYGLYAPEVFKSTTEVSI